MTAAELSGGCLCGQIRYTLASAPTDLNDCHCVDCRRSTGAPYLAWGTVPRRDCKVVRGKVRVVQHANRLRRFAACCGTQLFFEKSQDDASIDVTLASLDDPAPFAPAIAIWTEDHLPWVPLRPELPAFPQSTS